MVAPCLARWMDFFMVVHFFVVKQLPLAQRECLCGHVVFLVRVARLTAAAPAMAHSTLIQASCLQ